MISFQGAQYPQVVIMFAVFFCVPYGASYRDSEEIVCERRVAACHTTLDHWVTRYSGAITEGTCRHKGACDRSGRISETYIRLRAWGYLCRAIDKNCKKLDFMLSRRRNKPAATKFVARILEAYGLSRKTVIDKSGTNTADIKTISKCSKVLAD